MSVVIGGDVDDSVAVMCVDVGVDAVGIDVCVVGIFVDVGAYRCQRFLCLPSACISMSISIRCMALASVSMPMWTIVSARSVSLSVALVLVSRHRCL